MEKWAKTKKEIRKKKKRNTNALQTYEKMFKHTHKREMQTLSSTETIFYITHCSKYPKV